MAINHYQVASDVLVAVLNCLDDPTCEYTTFVSLGKPPQECNYIAANWVDDIVVKRDMERCYTSYRHVYDITLNRCCAAESLEFNPAEQDENARCFLKDYDALLCCVQTYIGSVLPGALNCNNPFVERGNPDPTVRGGCFSATIRFGFEKLFCGDC